MGKRPKTLKGRREYADWLYTVANDQKEAGRDSTAQDYCDAARLIHDMVRELEQEQLARRSTARPVPIARNF